MRVVWAVFIALQALGNVASLSYEVLGAVQGAQDFAGVATTYANDIRGNVTRESSAGPAPGLTEQRSYTLAGQLSASRLLPQLAWDSAGRLAQVQQRHALRGATGAQQAVITSANTYDATGRLTASAHSAPAGLTLPTGSALSDTLGANASGYAWDANGNRSQSHYSSATAAGTATLKRNYVAVSGSNRLQNYTQTFQPASGSAQTSTVAYSHDATGSLTRKGDNYLHYGSDGRIAKAGLNADPANTLAVSYTYNALGQRVFKSDARLSGANNPAITQQTVYAEDGIGSTVLGQYGNRRSSNSAAPAGEMDSTEVIYLPTASGPMPVAAQINGRLYAIDADHLNTPRRLTNTQGQVVWQWLITGFGEANPTTGATGYAQSGQGSANYSEAVKFDLRYPGQVWDEETGLAYNLNRYYDREGGRYIQADPIGLEGGWNRYLYVEGSPTNLVDPSGLASVMPGGGLADSPLLDNGSSCSPMFQQPRVDDGGCIATSGGPSICIGPGSIKSVGNLSKEVLKGIGSLEKQIAQHEKKLLEFMNNPTVRPGMENQPLEVIRRQQMIRMEHLRTEINTFRNNIEKLRNGGF
ncbi:hypothetical protein AVHY2522_22490 [Acidovorax sp. SUPP2522]|uniref:RHS repeat-associated core domain-containing protein n=1 Tax=unclassified Acidovorax TaxID=2684926 RepID=UPI0023491FED|nr:MULTISPECIES: RHS repeat-associated core domain-containing protein [unclassified Acidovorax]WCM97268.1 hypothetical protein M5C96_23215 [Acidovorax sp. GBBC 1281]GKT19446.1 hypothetical protein AVHY2522_22490 [Acidovorax sp. SUPP2522]